MNSKWSLILIIIFCSGIFCWFIHRDIQIEKQYTVDLRNRIVGARLQMDGKPPYFYKWKPADGLRYYDPIGIDTTYANAITASPFFHHLISPIANLQQRKISQIWLAIQYSLFFGCMLIAFSFTENARQQWAVAITSILFLFTEAWLTLIHHGQIYILFPFLAFLFLFFFQRKNSLVFSFLAGLTAIILFLSRPTMLLFFLPFLFLLHKHSYKYLLAFFIPVVILLSYSLFNKQEKSFWLNYKEGITAQIKDQQSNDHAVRNNAYKPIRYENWEGWNEDSINKERLMAPMHLKLEYTGVKELVKYLFHKRVPSSLLLFSFSAVTFLFMTIFYFQQRNEPSVQLTVIAIFGFCLYMLSDFFSPILRIQYYTVQWIFPLLLCAAFYNPRLKVFYILLITGLTLNVLNTPQIKMRHSVGEFLILFTLLWFCLHRQSNNKQAKAPLYYENQESKMEN